MQFSNAMNAREEKLLVGQREMRKYENMVFINNYFRQNITTPIFKPSFTDIDFRNWGDCIRCGGQQQPCHVLPVLRGSTCQLDICYAPQIAPVPLTQKASNLKILGHKTNMWPHASTKKTILMEQSRRDITWICELGNG